MIDVPDLDAGSTDVDVVFKRSYKPALRQTAPSTDVRPLGLTLACTAPGLGRLSLIALRRHLLARGLRHGVSALRVTAEVVTSGLAHGERVPEPVTSYERYANEPVRVPYVTYLVKAWDPSLRFNQDDAR